METARRQGFFFLFLLPLSFAAQSLSEQFGRATVWDALLVAAVAAVGTILLALALRLVFSKRVAALSATLAALLFLYWSYPYLRLKWWSGDAMSLKGILGGLFLFWAGLSWGLSRLSVAGQQKTVQFFNLLFGVLLVVNSSLYVFRKWNSPVLVSGEVVTAQSPARPPVFILLFDEAASTESLRRRGLSDWGLDSFLEARHFFQVKESQSNYSFTHFSVASALHEQYLSLPAGHNINLQDYNNALCCIQQSSVVRSFARSGYEICNRSVFNLGNTRPFEGETPLVEGTRALTAGTLWARLIRPVWTQKTGSDSLNWFEGLERNPALLKALAQDGAKTNPVWVYAHFFLPHSPFYFDAAGKLLPLQTSLEQTFEKNLDGFAANWKVAVAYMKTAVETIQKANPNALILLIGDHGYRNEALPGDATARFQNLCAVYYPDQNYGGFTRHTTLVNTMRLLHNKALGTTLPLLPPKTIPLSDTKNLDW